MSSRKSIIWDLDSTLIDTNEVFETAQRNLIRSLSVPLLEFNIRLDSEDKKEMDLLRKVDYEGIKIRGHTGYDSPNQLPLSLLSIYLERSDAKPEYKAAWLASTGSSIAEAEGSKYLVDLDRIPKKFDGIEDVLEASKDNYNLIFTEYFGDREKQYKKLIENGLEKYFDHVIMTEKKDKFSMLSTIEYVRLENGIKPEVDFPIIYIDDRSKYLELAKSVYPKCYTVNTMFGANEIFRESSAAADCMVRDVEELKKFILGI